MTDSQFVASSPDEKAILEWCRDQVGRVKMMLIMMMMIMMMMIMMRMVTRASCTRARQWRAG